MPQRLIPFRTTATACLLALALLLGATAAHAKTLYSPVLATGNAEDEFFCSFQNVHQKKAASISFLIFEIDSQTTVLENAVILDPNFVAIYSVAGAGLYICIIQTQGGTVRSYVGLGAEGRMDEVQRVE